MTGKIQQCLAAAGRILYAFTERPSELWSSVRLLCGKYFLSNINIHKDILAYVYKNFHAVPSFPPRKTPPQEPKRAEIRFFGTNLSSFNCSSFRLARQADGFHSERLRQSLRARPESLAAHQDAGQLPAGDGAAGRKHSF